MKVLVLSCSTGGGHDAAAKAIVEAFHDLKIECDFQDYLAILGEDISKKVCNWYLSWTQKEGNVFKVLYKLGDLYSKTKLTSPIYALNKLGAKKLYQYIIDNNYDYIVTSHLYSALALTAIKKEHGIRYAQVATDYVCIPFWEESNPDFFFIPHPALIDDFVKKGINKDVLVPTGIPTFKKFHKKRDKIDLRQKLHLKNKRTILIMSGSMGFGNILELVHKLKMATTAQLVVICGNNHELKQKLEKQYPEVISLGFINNVYEYMQASDIVLTKPGGLTTTETAVSNIPLIHTMPIPGCENYNARFFDERGMSVACSEVNDIVYHTKRLLNSKKAREKMIERQQKNINAKAAHDICKIIIEKERTRN